MTLDTLKFQGQWREYQARVLSELESHLDDNHLHVVAAPGSGKTILGLEVMRRLGNPAIILAPSIAIRNQWIDRLSSMFMENDQNIDEWVTKDIRAPKALTFITYQALHAVFSGDKIEDDEDLNVDPEEEEESTQKKKPSKKAETAKIIDLLKKAKVQTIVLDEAHHLRKEWWSALKKLKAKLDAPSVVSLTATPPYDVSYAQWQKYEELCGPIDTEISVPELVKCENLCPHQDYVYFSLPTENEAGKLRQFKGDIRDFLGSLKENKAFLAALAAHPWINDPKSHIEAILDEPESFSAFIIYLHSAGFTPPKHVLKILGVHKNDIPPITPEWLEILLTNVLYKHTELLCEHEETLSSIRKHLKKIGAIERRKVVIDNTKEIKKLLASSLAKLDSIVDIARQESTYFGDNLRMVVLADYIRMAELPSKKGDLRPIDKIGVIPIFEYLRRARVQGLKIGILTGSIVIIPRAAEKALKEGALQIGIDHEHVKFTPLIHDEDYLRVEITGASRQKTVQLITNLFNQGHITSLVGTQALLGEGWDAPSINTLILASHVGSFMLSNQMRGRAIRVDPQRPDKAANIWHLAALDIESVQEKFEYMLTGKTSRKKSFDPFDEIAEDLGHDLRTLRRRFRAFEGLSYNAPILIENGFKRLGLSDAKWNEAGVRQTNQNTLNRASQRASLADLWSKALEGNSPNPAMREKVESNYVPRGLAFADTLKYMAMNALIGGFAYGSQIIQGAQGSKDFVVLLSIAILVAVMYATPKLIKALYLLVRNGSIESSLKQVSWAVLDTLQYMELTKTHRKKIKIRTVKDKMGMVYCRIDGATNIEKRHFLNAMKEVLGPIENARYILVRHSYLGSLLRVDYHPVPRTFAANKKYASFFHKKWSRYIGGTKLIYTRTPEGRATLLKARTKSLSSAFIKKTDQTSVWE